jgi:hypothetical protein
VVNLIASMEDAGKMAKVKTANLACEGQPAVLRV